MSLGLTNRILIVDDVAGELFQDFVCACLPKNECVVVKSVSDMRTMLEKQTSPYDWLFLNVHRGVGTRSEGGILPLLEELVTKSEGTPRLVLYGYETDRKRALGRGVAEHPFLTEKFLNTWTYLSIPVLLEDTKKELDQSKPLDSNVRSAVAQVRASRLDREIRHKLAGVTAAVRILNGALRSGDYDVSDRDVRGRLDQAFTALLGACAGVEFDGLKAEINELIIAAQAGAQAVEERPEKTRKAQATEGKTQQKKELLPGRQLLIVDDEKAVWEPVWKFLLNTDTVSFAITSEEALNKVKSSSSTYDAVILDLDLGKASPMNGIKVLQYIKHAHLDLPVVVATATHHAEFAKRCMRLGASGYFLKELVETEKDSIQYYETLRKVVTAQLRALSPERKIWRQYIKLEGKVDNLDRSRGTSIAACFKKAYYLLTMEEGHVIPNSLLVPPWLATEVNKPSGQYDGALFQAQNAADQAMIASTMKKDEITYDQAQDKIYAFTQNGNERPVPPHFGERCRRANLSLGSRLCGIERSPLGEGDLRHYFYSKNSPPLSKKKAIEGIEALLTILGCLPNEKMPGSSSARSPEFTRLELPAFLARPGRSHYDISVAGATALQAGFAVGGTDLKSGRVLFLDDEGEQSAWWQPLRQCFTDWKGEIVVSTTVPIDQVSTYDLVLLDLVHNGDHEQGIRFLDVIRQRDIALPVIVLTAADDAYYCRKALVHGSNDYFLKEPLPGMTDKQFFETFRSLIERWVGDKESCEFRRRYWSELQKIEVSNFGCPSLDESDVRYERIKHKRHIPKKADNKVVLQFLRNMVAFPLREAFFHYLLETSPEAFLDEWKARCLVSSNPGVEVSLSMGQLVECLMWFLNDIQSSTEGKPDAGFLVGTLCYPRPLKRLARSLWKIRTQAKAQKTGSLEIVRLLCNGLCLARDFTFFVRPPFRSFQEHENVKASIEDCFQDLVMVEVELDGVNWPAFIRLKHFWSAPSVESVIVVRYVGHGQHSLTGADWIELAPLRVENPPGDYQGVVDHYDPSKGFGIIKAEIGQRVRVHKTQVKNNALVQGDRVTFNVVAGEKGWQARNVRRNG